MIRRLLAKLAGSKKRRKPAARKKPAARPKSRPKPKPRPKQKARSKKKPAPPQKAPAPPPGKEIGRIIAFFRIPVVAVVKVKQGGLKTGDRICIRGHTTDLKMTVASMQINHQPVEQIGKGDEAGIKVSSRARRGDRVYLLPS